MNFSTLRNIQGLFAPLKLQMEFKAVQQVSGHRPVRGPGARRRRWNASSVARQLDKPSLLPYHLCCFPLFRM